MSDDLCQFKADDAHCVMSREHDHPYHLMSDGRKVDVTTGNTIVDGVLPVTVRELPEDPERARLRDEITRKMASLRGRGFDGLDSGDQDYFRSQADGVMPFVDELAARAKSMRVAAELLAGQVQTYESERVGLHEQLEAARKEVDTAYRLADSLRGAVSEAAAPDELAGLRRDALEDMSQAARTDNLRIVRALGLGEDDDIDDIVARAEELFNAGTLCMVCGLPLSMHRDDEHPPAADDEPSLCDFCDQPEAAHTLDEDGENCPTPSDVNSDGDVDFSVEPQIGGEARVSTSAWPADVTNVWLEVDSYATNDNATAGVVLQPDEAREIAADLVKAAAHADHQRTTEDLGIDAPTEPASDLAREPDAPTELAEPNQCEQCGNEFSNPNDSGVCAACEDANVDPRDELPEDGGIE